MESQPPTDRRAISFLAFWLIWAKHQGWTVPHLHVLICTWLQHCTAPERVLMVFRGAAKSTIYAGYKAWRLYRDRTHRSLVWSADNETAGMLTADVINVLRNHPLTGGMLPKRPGAKRFWVTGTTDARNASVRAVGVNSNATAARANDVDFDDVEVPGNIETPEARLKLRQRISESTHIALPGAQKTYIGTPHAHDSIYPERIAGGAEVLMIPLFQHLTRYTETRERTEFPFTHEIGPDGLYVMTGIGKGARMLELGIDYRWSNGCVVFAAPPGAVVDIASCCVWPERFTRAEIAQRRKECLTLNAFDSQYQLQAKPLSEIRLDPEKIIPYDAEPRFVWANKRLTMWLGAAQIVGASMRWDPASGKLNSDVSAVVLDLQDATGNHYWHRMQALTGEVAETSRDGKTIVGGQVYQLCDLIEKFKVRRVTVETNGIGKFAPAFLKTCLKQRRIACGVQEVDAVVNKARRILEALEPLMQSRMLWAHMSVLEGPLWDQAKNWNPAERDQKDDFLDAGAGAVTDQPVRVGSQTIGKATDDRDDDWRPDSGVFDVELEA